MRNTSVWVWGMIILVSAKGWYWSCSGCSEPEKIALVQLNSSINFLADEVNADCCEWDGVECDPTTARVIGLSLNNSRSYDLGDWYFNASLFLPFEELKHLFLPFTYLAGWIENEGFERLSTLKNLEKLDLSYNHFNDSVLSSVSRISTLKYLNLGWNRLGGSTHFHSSERLKGLRKLEVLILRGNELNTSIGSFLKLDDLITLKELDLTNNKIRSIEPVSQGLEGSLPLRNLEVLKLSNNNLTNSIFSSLGGFSSLKFLDLSGNRLNGSDFHFRGLCELRSLKGLDLSHNKFWGNLPLCAGNLTSLQLMDLSDNQFTGNIALSPLTSLTSLEYLDLSENHFQVPQSFMAFANHSKLQAIIAENNECIMDGTTHLFKWAPTFQLKIFVLSNCMANNLPDFLHHQNDLRFLDLSHNNLSSTFPTWLLSNNTRFESLWLRNNNFTGPFVLPSYPIPNISTLDVSSNHIHGQIPGNMSLIFQNLKALNMSSNLFHGDIRFCFNDMELLDGLDLSYNNFSGNIPEQLPVGCPSLSFLHLKSNHFTGEVPISLSTMILLGLDFSNNHLSGKLPRWNGSISENIKYIVMSQNHFQGLIPIEFCKLDVLEFLDLSGNNLSGSIPSCFNPPTISHVHLQNNRLQGPLTHAFYNSSTLLTLDLRKNYFSGKIPNWIDSLSSLRVLLLKGNYFEGKIPAQLCDLSQLTIMDLSQNSLSGPIAPCLGTSFAFKAVGRISYSTDFEYPIGQSLAEAIQTYVNPRGFGLWLNKKHSFNMTTIYKESNAEEEVQFTTKGNSLSYKGNILNFMSGIDLSCNQLAGEIPPEIGNLSNIRALNLSHNGLIGLIPATFSNLQQLESLNLSYNHLNGRIPPQLAELNYLAIFSVAHNNLSGAIPARDQFGTFEESSYEGNPLLCGPLLPNSCVGNKTNSSSMIPAEDSSLIDMYVFYVSFVVSSVIAFLTVVVVFYLNSYWRQAWFGLVEMCATRSYYFIVDSLPKLPNFTKA